MGKPKICLTLEVKATQMGRKGKRASKFCSSKKKTYRNRAVKIRKMKKRAETSLRENLRNGLYGRVKVEPPNSPEHTVRKSKQCPVKMEKASSASPEILERTSPKLKNEPANAYPTLGMQAEPFSVVELSALQSVL